MKTITLEMRELSVTDKRTGEQALIYKRIALKRNKLNVRHIH